MDSPFRWNRPKTTTHQEKMRRPNYTWLSPVVSSDEKVQREPMNPKRCALARLIDANVTQDRLEAQMELIKELIEKKAAEKSSLRIQNVWQKDEKDTKNARAEAVKTEQDTRKNNVIHARQEFAPETVSAPEEFRPKTGPCHWSTCRLGRLIYFQFRRASARKTASSQN